MSFGPPQPQPPTYAQAMPDSVYAARAIVWVTVGISLPHAYAADTAYGSGYVIGGYLMTWILAIVALWYPTGRGGVHTASVTLAVLQVVFALSALVNNHLLLGVIPLAAAVAVLVLLRKDPAEAWFARPRTPAPPYS